MDTGSPNVVLSSDEVAIARRLRDRVGDLDDAVLQTAFETLFRPTVLSAKPAKAKGWKCPLCDKFIRRHGKTNAGTSRFSAHLLAITNRKCIGLPSQLGS